MSEALADIIRPGSSRGLDFVILEELRKRTGVNPDAVLKWALAEMLCNSLDTNATELNVDVQVEGGFYRLRVSDNGSKKLTLKELKLIVNFENKASSKRGFLRVSRGYLGNALKCVFGYSYALAESKEIAPPDIIVESGNREYRIALKPDRIKEVIKSKIVTTKRKDDGFTRFTVKFPKDNVNCSMLKDLIFATGMVNASRKIRYNILGDKGTQGSALETKAIRQETSVLWYNTKQFTALFQDFLRARPDTQLKEFIALFRGFTGKKVIREILQKLNSVNHDCQENNTVQFLPATPLKDLPAQAVSKLFVVMKAKAKPIAKRSVNSVLGCVGEAAFEKIREQNGWERLRYVVMKARKTECPNYRQHLLGLCERQCGHPDHVEFPYLIELAVFDRESNDQEGLKVYQCVNFMASMEDIFSKIFNINYRLGIVGIRQGTPVTVLAHLISPCLKWLNYGKGGLGE